MNLRTLLESLPIVRQIVAVLDDMNVVVAGLLLLAAGLVSETGIQNADDISQALIYLSGWFAAGYTVWDIIDLWQKKSLPKG